MFKVLMRMIGLGPKPKAPEVPKIQERTEEVKEQERLRGEIREYRKGLDFVNAERAAMATYYEREFNRPNFLSFHDASGPHSVGPTIK